MSYESEAKQETECGILVTKVDIFPFKDGGLGHIRALANIVLNDSLIIRGLRVMDGENGLFLSYPVDPFFKGSDFRSLILPVTRELREYIEGKVIEQFQKAVENG